MDLPEELSEIKLLQRYHDAFYKLFRLPLDWLPPDNRVYTVCGKEHCNPLCVRMMGCQEGEEHCRRLAVQRLEECRRTRKPMVSVCDAGFADALIPIFVKDEYIGSLCIGQYLPHRPGRAEMKRVEKNLSYLHLAPGELADYWKNTRILPAEEAEGLMALVQMIGEFICDTHGRLRFLESMAQSNPIKSAEKFIQVNYAKDLNVEGLARSFAMSKSYFMHQFTKQVGESPISYLNSFRIVKAKELLSRTDANVSQIAYACGFRTLPHFNRQFKKAVGCTPGEYRQHTAEKQG